MGISRTEAGTSRNSCMNRRILWHRDLTHLDKVGCRKGGECLFREEVVSSMNYKKKETFIKDLTYMVYKRCNPLQHLVSLCELDQSQGFFPKTSIFTDLLTVRMYMNHASIPLCHLQCFSPTWEDILDWALKSKQQCFLCSKANLCFDNLLNIETHFGIKDSKIYY